MNEQKSGEREKSRKTKASVRYASSQQCSQAANLEHTFLYLYIIKEGKLHLCPSPCLVDLFGYP